MLPVAITDLLISRGLNALVLVGLVSLSLNNQETVRGRLVTQHMGEFGNAMADYARQNSVLLATETAGGPIAVTQGTLQAAGVLATDFTPKNIAGQTPVGIVMQPVANQLELVSVETGGVSLNDARAAVAAQIGGGGFGAYQAGAPTVIKGAGGHWSVPIANFTAATGITPTKGSVAFRSTLGVNTVVSDFLSRIDTGNPESAKMHQAINMNGNNLNNIGDGTIQAMSVNLSQAVFRPQTVASGSTIAQPTCVAGEAAHLELAPVTFNDGGTGDNMSNVTVYDTVNGTTSWTVHMAVQTQAGTITDPLGTTVQATPHCQ